MSKFGKTPATWTVRQWRERVPKGLNALLLFTRIPGLEWLADMHPTDAYLRIEALLTERENTVFRLRFGVDRPSMRLEDVGHDLGVTRERVRQIEARLIEKLRRAGEGADDNGPVQP